jgi:hypothetical protein
MFNSHFLTPSPPALSSQDLKDFSLKEIFSGGITLGKRTGGILGYFCLWVAWAKAIFSFERLNSPAEGVTKEKNIFRNEKDSFPGQK